MGSQKFWHTILLHVVRKHQVLLLAEMDAELLLFFFLNSVVEHVRSERERNYLMSTSIFLLQF